MKKSILSFLLFISSLSFLMAQIEFEDDFESYQSGQIGPQSDDWTTWSGNEGGQEEAYVTPAFANSGVRSLRVEGNPVFPQGGPMDCILKLGNRTEGRYELSWSLWVNDADGAYFNIQHFEAPGTEWAFGVEIMAGGIINGETGMSIEVNNVSSSYPYQRGVWNRIKFIIDLDNDEIEMWLNDDFLQEWVFSYQQNTDTGTNQLGAVNFFPEDFADKFYIDDVKLELLSPNSVEENQFSSIKVTPTLVEDYLTINLGILSLNDIEIVLFNQLGQPIQQLDNSGKYYLGNLVAGTYFLKIVGDGLFETKQIIKI